MLSYKVYFLKEITVSSAHFMMTILPVWVCSVDRPDKFPPCSNLIGEVSPWEKNCNRLHFFEKFGYIRILNYYLHVLLVRWGRVWSIRNCWIGRPLVKLSICSGQTPRSNRRVTEGPAILKNPGYWLKEIKKLWVRNSWYNSTESCINLVSLIYI